jgi:glycosyltransferase involved in cell wall biosynthesis
MQSLSILHLVSNRWWTGTAEPVLALVKGVLERQHQVILGAPSGSQVEELARKAGIPLLEGLHLDPRFHPRSWLQDVHRLVRFLAETPVDVLHMHLTHDHWLGFLAASLRQGLTPRPTICVRTVHSLRHSQARTSRWLLRYGADHLVTVSISLRRALMEKCHIAPGAITVIPGAVDTQRFHLALSGAAIREELQLDPQVPLVGIVARIAPSRGHLTLVEAFAHVHRAIPQARLLLVGKGEFRPAVERRVDELGLANIVLFAGYREDDLPEILAALDLFVLLAPGSEGSCRAALEAMAVGKPVIASRLGALEDIVRDGETGLLIEPHAPLPLAHAINRLLRSPDSARLMGLRGRERVECAFSRPHQVEGMLGVYQDICIAQQASSASRGST